MTAPSRAAPTITRAWLEDRGACHDQVATFAAEWPDGVEITREALLRAAELGLDLSWFADHVLSEQARQAYDVAIAPALQAYRVAIAPALQAYDVALEPARQAYRVALAQARQAYDVAIAPALQAYDVAIAQAPQAYDVALAPARQAYDVAIAQALLTAGAEHGWTGCEAQP
jgi:predicted DsbA family dithiol-disulfide isomerase